MSLDFAVTDGTLTMGSSFAIPSAVWRHNVIVLVAHRWRKVASVVLSKELLMLDKSMLVKLVSHEGGDSEADQVWELEVTNAGVVYLRAKGTSVTGDPVIRVYGIL